jgi:hypothetical protein
VAIVLLAILAVRLWLQQRGWPPIAAAGAGVVGLLVWPVLTLLEHVPGDPSIFGARNGSLISRAHSTYDGAVPYLHVVGLAVLCSVVGLVVARHLRGRLGLGNDLWSWAALLGGVAVLGGAYVFGPGNIALWLATSVNRTTIFLALLSWWIVALWTVSGLAVVMTVPTTRSGATVSLP